MIETQFKFRPIHFNWVALHPQPIGIVHFIGGAFFGTFPTIFYRYLLRRLFAEGYTIIALPFRFTFRHWSVAISLVSDQQELRLEILEAAKRLGYDYKLYEQQPTSRQPNDFWLAHSVGCKYVALLELLSDLDHQTIQEVLGGCVGADQYRELQQKLGEVVLQDISLANQPFLLMAPVVAGIESAIPLPAIAKFVKKLGLDVKPSASETFCLIEESRLFNLIALMSFSKDKIAASTVSWLRDRLANKPVEFLELTQRRHLAPLGWRNGDSRLAEEAIRLLADLRQRLVGS